MNQSVPIPLMLRAMNDLRVTHALEIAVRDLEIVHDFHELRRAGHTVESAVSHLATTYFLSEEHIRTIVYDKKHHFPGMLEQ